MLEQLKKSWFSNVRGDILAGITVALALIPESISFSLMVGVGPMVGLYASFCIAVIISIVGGRPGMISAATGAMALLMVSLVKDHGIEYLFAATILAGVLQYIMGVLKLGQLIQFIPQSVMLGFVNALGILIFTTQLVHFVGATWIMYALVALTLVIIYTLPKFTKVIPSPLAAIIIVSIIAVAIGADLKTVGDRGLIESTLPLFHIPDTLFSLHTLWIILPYSFSLSIVGILESLLTASVLDEMTDTTSNKNKEVRGQGIANMVTGFFGGMAGCALIGQSVINVKSGGRTRLSTFVAGSFLLFLIMVLSDVVNKIPMAALVGVMIMVSISTFDWKSVFHIHKVPRTDALIMIVTVVIVLITHDLSKGVFAGVVLSAFVFVGKMAKIRVSIAGERSKNLTYHVTGQLFFGTTSRFVTLFNYKDDPTHVTINFSGSHVWDQSAVTAIAKVKNKYEQLNKKVSFTGLNEESKLIIRHLGLTSSGGH
ncbi:sodium-independent anion transporter [Paenibacillus sp. FSL A5-0031]|uniref:SulP family inorganic anion transporter n=1 Tax=unclassified Paenibacillus TaxID=185978 RepID=UPI00096BDF5D|nr:SulP family inorganic anion transporter [Paenibacillus sp. FSL A5-0031]OME80165.1 sodium-independent anion transporter [Paenibacillus sp. FSL A5-0031]